MIHPHLGRQIETYPVVAAALTRIRDERVVERVWERDHRLWSDSPDEIENRLGWLDLPVQMADEVARLRTFTDAVRTDGYTHAVLLGMGGSSLAPEVFSKTFGVTPGHPELRVLDSTHPDAVGALESQIDLSRTLFIVSSKSGGTAETLSMFKYFWGRAVDSLGAAQAGARFVAVTDPGSSLEALGTSLGLREVFLANPNLGGRYSALSHFGLVPASLIGVDLDRLLESARSAAAACSSAEQDNPGMLLGAALGSFAQDGRDKATFVTSASVASFGDWVEQLIAESTGKCGKGILPVIGEQVGFPGSYGNDRLFIEFALEGERDDTAKLDALEDAGHPVARVVLDSAHDLGAQIFIWEFAVAVAGHLMGIHPFDQPDVEAAKVISRRAIQAFMEEGSLPAVDSTTAFGDIQVWDADPEVSDVPSALSQLLSEGRAGDYVAIQAFVPPSFAVDDALARLRTHIGERTGLATTVGYGPRFLHSTGQLHKGDAGRGLFIQLISESTRDLRIPDEPGSASAALTFGVLTLAEAQGDRAVLVERGRRVLTLTTAAKPVRLIEALLG